MQIGIISLGRIGAALRGMGWKKDIPVPAISPDHIGFNQ